MYLCESATDIDIMRMCKYVIYLLLCIWVKSNWPNGLVGWLFANGSGDRGRSHI